MDLPIWFKRATDACAPMNVNKGFPSVGKSGAIRTMTPEFAELIGLKALAWLAGNDELCPVFLGSSGASEADLRTGAQDPAFLGAVLEFVTMDDQWVIAFCDSAGLGYEEPIQARQALPGGEEVSWT